MQGTITWIEATEENVREIPLDETAFGYPANKISIRVAQFFKTPEGQPFIITGQYSFDLKKWVNTIGNSSSSHFAYINEPE